MIAYGFPVIMSSAPPRFDAGIQPGFWQSYHCVWNVLKIMCGDEQEERTERSQQNLYNPHRSGQIDQSLRTNKNYIGLHIALYLLIISALIHFLDLYSSIVAGGVFMLAILVTVVSLPYKTLQEMM